MLFCIPTLERSGPDRVFFELLSALDRKRFLPILAVQKSSGYYLSRLPEDIPVHFIGDTPATGAGYPAESMRRAIEEIRPDVILSTLRMTATVTHALVGLKGPRPVHVIRPANHVTENFRELCRKSPLYLYPWLVTIGQLWRADYLIAQSSGLRGDFARYVPLAGRSAVIGNPVDPAQLRRLAGKPARVEGQPSLLAIGRLSHQKGFDLLLPAFKTVLASHPQAVLHLIGEGQDAAALGEQAAALGIAENLRLHGRVDEPYPMIAGCTLFVSSSRYEGFPNVILEALALGKPVVATDCPGGTRDLVVEGQTGWLVGSNDAAALGQGLLRALAEPKRYSAQQLVGFVEARFSSARIVKAYEAALLDALRCRHSPEPLPSARRRLMEKLRRVVAAGLS